MHKLQAVVVYSGVGDWEGFFKEEKKEEVCVVERGEECDIHLGATRLNAQFAFNRSDWSCAWSS